MNLEPITKEGFETNPGLAEQPADLADAALAEAELWCAWCGKEADPSLRTGPGLGWRGCRQNEEDDNG